MPVSTMPPDSVSQPETEVSRLYVHASSVQSPSTDSRYAPTPIAPIPTAPVIHFQPPHMPPPPPRALLRSRDRVRSSTSILPSGLVDAVFRTVFGGSISMPGTAFSP